MTRIDKTKICVVNARVHTIDTGESIANHMRMNNCLDHFIKMVKIVDTKFDRHRENEKKICQFNDSPKCMCVALIALISQT